MVVDSAGSFVTQRELPGLAAVVPWVTEGGLTLCCGDKGEVTVERALWSEGAAVTVEVWRDRCEAIDQGDAVAQWLSTVVGKTVRLVRMHDRWFRSSKRVREGETVGLGFCDGYPLLFVTQESLDALNVELEQNVEVERFRPNVVLEGCDQAWEEDRWQSFAIAGVSFEAVKPCERCVITTLDPVTGAKKGREPLATLAKQPRGNGRALFGMNVNHYGHGTIALGDRVETMRFGERVAL